MFYKSTDLNSKQNYKFLSGSVIPRPIAWVTSLSADGLIVNAAPFSFYNVVASDIPLIMIAVMRENNGQQKHTAANILKRHEAVVHVADLNNKVALNTTSASIDKNLSEIDLAHLKLEDSCLIGVPRIKGTPIQLETTLYKYIPLKNNAQKVMTDLLLLHVVGYHFSDDVFDKNKEYLKSKKIAPISRLAGNTFAELGKEFELKRPK